MFGLPASLHFCGFDDVPRINYIAATHPPERKWSIVHAGFHYYDLFGGWVVAIILGFPCVYATTRCRCRPWWIPSAPCSSSAHARCARLYFWGVRRATRAWAQNPLARLASPPWPAVAGANDHVIIDSHVRTTRVVVRVVVADGAVVPRRVLRDVLAGEVVVCTYTIAANP